MGLGRCGQAPARPNPLPPPRPPHPPGRRSVRPPTRHRPARAQRSSYAHAMHMLCMHMLCTCYAGAMCMHIRTPYTYHTTCHARAMHLPYKGHARVMHGPCTGHARAMHMHTCVSSTVEYIATNSASPRSAAVAAAHAAAAVAPAPAPSATRSAERGRGDALAAAGASTIRSSSRRLEGLDRRP